MTSLRVVIDTGPDRGLMRMHSPDLPPSMARVARGMDQCWYTLQEFTRAYADVEPGTWETQDQGVLDEILADADSSDSKAVQAAAEKVRAALNALSQLVADEQNRARQEAEARERQQAALAEVRRAEQALEEARRRALEAGVQLPEPRVPAAVDAGDGSPRRVVASSKEIRERRARIDELIARGVTSQAEIAHQLGITAKTVSNDLRAMKGNR